MLYAIATELRIEKKKIAVGRFFVKHAPRDGRDIKDISTEHVSLSVFLNPLLTFTDETMECVTLSNTSSSLTF